MALKSIPSIGSLLLLLSTYVVASLPPGASNPTGYLVLTYYTYSFCEGPVQEKMATAMNTCISSRESLRGEPYGNGYYVYTFNDVGNVDAYLYSDQYCKTEGIFYETIILKACSTAGDPAYATYSSELPDLNIDDAIVRQVIYNLTNSSNCDHDNDIVLTSAIYTSACRINCNYNSAWETCEFTSCQNGTVKTTYSDSNDDTCSVPIGYEVTTSKCDQTITCVNGGDSSSSDEAALPTWGIAVVSVVSILAIIGAGIALYYYFILKAAAKTNSMLDVSLVRSPNSQF